jgi:hypothetical protein
MMHDYYLLLAYREQGNHAEPTFISFFTSQNAALLALEKLDGYARASVFYLNFLVPHLSKTFPPAPAPVATPKAVPAKVGARG